MHFQCQVYHAALAGQAFPTIIPLLSGFSPEGIAIGKGHTFYAGSLANGAIYQGDLRTGKGSILFEGQARRLAVGLKYDQRSQYLFVSGGPTGYAYVYDTRNGAEVGAYQLSVSGSFINDVIVTRQAAYFTDSLFPWAVEMRLLETVCCCAEKLCSWSRTSSTRWQPSSCPRIWQAVRSPR